MSANDLAKKLLDAATIYAAIPNGTPPLSQNRPIMLATVDPAYSGSGVAKVTFDGETTMSAKAYVTSAPVAAGSRVYLLPIGKSYVIAGTLGQGAGFNVLNNSRFRANQRNYVSGAALGAGLFAVDRWRDPRVTNNDTNPRMENATSGWTATLASGAGAATGVVSAVQNHSPTGTKSLAVAASSTGDAYMAKTYNTSANQAYTVSIWVYLTATGSTFAGDGRCLLITGGASSVTVTSDQTKLNQWQLLSATVVATGTTIVVRLYPYLNNTSTIYFDDVVVTQGSVLYGAFSGADSDCSWTGTVDASTSYNAPNVAASLTFTSDPHGQPVTLNANGRVQQTVERGNVAAALWTLSAALTGTAAMRAYNASTLPGARPAFQTAAATYVLDGSVDVIVEFTGGVSGGTVDRVKFESGSAASLYQAENVDDELRRCQRYYVRVTATVPSDPLIYGFQVSTTAVLANLQLGAPLRALPIVTLSLVEWSDQTTFGSAITVINAYAGVSLQSVSLQITIAAGGASLRPGIIRVSSPGPGYIEFDSELK